MYRIGMSLHSFPRSIEHFASRGAMDIEGLGIAIVENLLKEGHIKSAADLYFLNASDIAAMEKMGENPPVTFWLPWRKVKAISFPGCFSLSA